MPKKNKSKPNKASTKKQRQVAPPTYKSFRLSKRIKPPQQTKVRGSLSILRSALKHIRKYWKVFAGITLVYLVLNIIFVRGFSFATDVPLIKESFDEFFGSGLGQIGSGLSLVFVVATAGASDFGDVANLYQSIVLIMISLAVIWVLRQTHAGNKVRTKDAFYQGMYPLVQFILVMLAIMLQLLPMLAGAGIVGIVSANNLAVTGAEQFIWWLFFGLLTLLSLYMVSSSSFALFIVTLADMTPIKALRSARQLVLYRRWLVVRRFVALPLIILTLTLVVMLPVIYIVPVAAEGVFFVLSGILTIVALGYLYELYRELL